MDNYIRKFKSKLKSFTKKYLKAENLIEIGKYIAIVVILLTLLIAGGTFLYKQVLFFINNHPLITCFIFIIILAIVEKILEKKPTSNMPEQMSRNARQATYTHLRSAVYRSLIELHDILGVYPPKSLEKLDPIKRYSIADEIVYFHFIALVKDKELNIDDVHYLLEDNINNLIRNKKIVGFNIDADTVINGCTYPPVMVHDICLTNKYIEITLALTSENYINQLNQQKRIDMSNNVKSDIFDDEDDEF